MADDELTQMSEEEKLNRRAVYALLGTGIFVSVLLTVTILSAGEWSFVLTRDGTIGAAALSAFIGAGQYCDIRFTATLCKPYDYWHCHWYGFYYHW